MQIDFASSGGFANLEMNYHGDTRMMPEEQARELERLVESSGAFELEGDDTTSQPRAAAGPPDVIVYRLTLSDGARQTTLWLNDATAPAAIRPLLAELRKRALEQKRQTGSAG